MHSYAKKRANLLASCIFIVLFLPAIALSNWEEVWSGYQAKWTKDMDPFSFSAVFVWGKAYITRDEYIQPWGGYTTNGFRDWDHANDHYILPGSPIGIEHGGISISSPSAGWLGTGSGGSVQVWKTDIPFKSDEEDDWYLIKEWSSNEDQNFTWIYGIDFIDDENGWVIIQTIQQPNDYYYHIYFTNDGGSTWTELDSWEAEREGSTWNWLRHPSDIVVSDDYRAIVTGRGCFRFSNDARTGDWSWGAFPNGNGEWKDKPISQTTFSRASIDGHHAWVARQNGDNWGQVLEFTFPEPPIPYQWDEITILKEDGDYSSVLLHSSDFGWAISETDLPDSEDWITAISNFQREQESWNVRIQFWKVESSSHPNGSHLREATHDGTRYALFYRSNEDSWILRDELEDNAESHVNYERAFKSSRVESSIHLSDNVLRIGLTLGSSMPAQIDIYDISGRRVFEGDLGYLSEGYNDVVVNVDTRGLIPGVYCYDIHSTGSALSTGKVLVLN